MFRGKRIDNGAWVDGCYMTDEQDLSKAYIGHIFGTDGGGMFIHDMDIVMVVPETVCQYTGLDDKNDRKIFEGDIVLYIEEYEFCDYGSPILCPENGETYFPRHRGSKRINAVVKYDEELCLVVVNPISKENYVRKSIKDYSFKNLEVIGNIFDNPELVRNDA